MRRMVPGPPFLIYSDPSGRRELLELGEDTASVTIGRRRGCDLALIWDDQVSRLHAELVRFGREWVLQDDGLSHNGTFLNGERVRGRRRLRAGDSITVGVTVIEVCGPEATAAGTRDSGAGQPPVAPTPAQRRTLTALCRPLLADPRAAPATNQVIAEELTLSVETVKGTMSALFERYGLSALPQNEKRVVLAQRALSDARSA